MGNNTEAGRKKQARETETINALNEAEADIVLIADTGVKNGIAPKQRKLYTGGKFEAMLKLGWGGSGQTWAHSEGYKGKRGVYRGGTGVVTLCTTSALQIEHDRFIIT